MCQLLDMEVYTMKTEIMVFRNGGPLRNFEKWTFNDPAVRVTSVYKYMGPCLPHCYPGQLPSIS